MKASASVTNLKGSTVEALDQINQIAQQQRKQVSPNMMLKKTKTAKEIKIENKIKELFENDPLEILRQA